VERALETGAIKREHLGAGVQEAFSSDQIDAFVTDVFLDEQEETRILQRLIKNDLSDNAIEFIRRERIAAREMKTLQDAMQIPNVIADIQELNSKYQLVIVSATSDELIQNVLKKHRLSGFFSYVFGRDSPLRAWSSVERKSQNFIKLSTMLGIPLERMIFIGDSDADYRAAKQLALPFIENSFNAGRYGRLSLIREQGPRNWLVLSSTSGPGGLIALVKKVEVQLGHGGLP
jgi:phosphoglycolate phosphatase-like HAD superfamily hydrolase